MLIRSETLRNNPLAITIGTIGLDGAFTPRIDIFVDLLLEVVDHMEVNTSTRKRLGDVLKTAHMTPARDISLRVSSAEFSRP